jgi:hypothetical protein
MEIVTTVFIEKFGFDPFTTKPIAITESSFDTLDGISSAEEYGILLAAFSALDYESGSINNTLTYLNSLNSNNIIYAAIDNVAIDRYETMTNIKQLVIEKLETLYDFDNFIGEIVSESESVEQINEIDGSGNDTTIETLVIDENDFTVELEPNSNYTSDFNYGLINNNFENLFLEISSDETSNYG